MRLVFTVGTAKVSGGTSVLLDMIKFSNELGIETLIHCIEPYISEAWLERHPGIPQIQANSIQQTDLLVVSEEFIFVAMDLSRYTTNYIVLNQGLNSSLVSDFRRNTYPVTKLLYQGARGVIANSHHTKENITKLFELDSDKVHLYTIHINDNFKPATKTNTVAYMPRRNRVFGCFVVNYLSGKYPETEFIAIDNMCTEEVITALGVSKLFLSFGGPEGFGMPPVEAAFSGCKVIGFDGGGGEEYFNEPIFTKVPFYDHMKFIEVSDNFMCSNYEWSDEQENQRLRLRDAYSLDSARQSFYNVIKQVIGV